MLICFFGFLVYIVYVCIYSSFASRRTRQFDESGKLKGTAKIEEKFQLGDRIYRATDEQEGTIIVMHPLHIELQADDGHVYKVTADDLLHGSEWKKLAEKKPMVLVADPQKWLMEMAVARVKAEAIVRLLAEGEKFHGSHANLEMYSKPKGVFTAANAAKRKLCLPPLTNRVELQLVSANKPQPTGSILMCEDKVHG